MELTKDQREKMSIICNNHFAMSAPDCGCGPCPLYSVCCKPTSDFKGKTLNDKTAEFERQMWTLAENVDMSAYANGVVSRTV